MGYERKSIQILGGGFTCLPPPDKIPITDYLLCQNFRTDTLGRLISRTGYPNVFLIAGGAGLAHSAFTPGGSGGPYYVATNTTTSGTPSNVYFSGLRIASGFDGNRVGFAAMNGFVWIMNRGNQGRHNYAAGFHTFETWTLAAPTASPTLAASTPTPSASVTYTYLPGQPNGYVHSLTIGPNTYSFPEIGYGPGQIALVFSVIANADPNCSVTYPGSGDSITITPIVPNTIFTIQGSDGNPTTNICTGATSDLPTGTYTFYITYQSADLSLESNPSPVSAPITVSGQGIAVTIPTADAPTDSRVGFINIYATGGTLNGAWRVGQIAWPVTLPATYTWATSDAAAIASGLAMPTTNDPPPAAKGIIGPHFGRLFAWSTAKNKNRLFWTDPDQPQYWPGAADPQIGNWVDVGLDDEEIVWCTIHSNLLVIYKERSIWLLIGTDPSADVLEQAYEGPGLCNEWALAAAGQIDYFVAPNGLLLFDMSMVHDVRGDIKPLFNQYIANGGPLTAPGNINPGGLVNPSVVSDYAVALGHAFGRLFLSYAENNGGGATQYNLLVFDEGPAPELQTLLRPQAGRWFYERNSISGFNGIFGFLFDGVQMIGLGGTAGGSAYGYALADFRSTNPTDAGGRFIECVYGSHYEDVGFPDNDKVWLEVAIDYEYLPGGLAANVYVAFNGGTIAPQLVFQLQGHARQTDRFGLGALPGALDAGYLARNMAVIIDAMTGGELIIHNVYLYYYVEARVAAVASTIPTDLGSGKIKQCKELELDIESLVAPSQATVVSDLPGNALAIRQTVNIAQAGRALLKYPFPTTEGLLWQVSVGGNSFRLYNARLLMRVLEVAVEGYETSAGFVWDSMEQPLTNGEVSTVDQVRFEMDSDGLVNVEVFTDLPGEGFTSKGVYWLTNGATGRHWALVVIPDGIEARSVQLRVTGQGQGYRLFRAQVRHAKIGRYLAGATVAGPDDSFRALEFTYYGERMGMFKRLEVDTWCSGTLLVDVLTDQDNQPVSQAFSAAITPTRRNAVVIDLPPGIRGRLFRVRLTSPSPARIYGLRAWTRPLSDPGAAWAWIDFPLETSDILATWTDLIAEQTTPVWQWVDLDMTVTE